MYWRGRYWRDNIQQSFMKWDRHEAISALVIKVVATVLAVVGGSVALGALDVALAMVFPVALAVWAATLVLVITPMEMWVGQAKKAASLEERTRPILGLVSEREEAGRIAGDRSWGLVIRNEGTDTASACSARIEALDFETPLPNLTLQRWPLDRPLQWAGQESDSYNIPGGQSAHLNVAYSGYIPGQNGTHVTLAYRADDAFRYGHVLPAGFGSILVLINLVSAGQNPQYIVCRLDIQAMRDMILQGLTKRQPFTYLYFGNERPDLSQYQTLPDTTRPA